MDEVKKLSIANFNITYGPENEPMLTYFQDILYPASAMSRKFVPPKMSAISPMLS